MKEKILIYDAEFTENGFKTYVDNAFIQIYLAVMSKDVERVKHFMSNEVYSVFEAKVEELKKRNLTQMYDEINVKSSELIDVYEDEVCVYVVVRLISRYMDYLIDLEGKFVSGNDKERVQKENIITFSKKKDSNGLGVIRKCPGCGASIDVNANGKCDYCDSIFDLENRDWVIVNFEVR